MSSSNEKILEAPDASVLVRQDLVYLLEPDARIVFALPDDERVDFTTAGHLKRALSNLLTNMPNCCKCGEPFGYDLRFVVTDRDECGPFLLLLHRECVQFTNAKGGHA